MLDSVQESPRAVFRNFNLCPHCEQRGEDPLLLRISECIPMISRSDGKNFHLLLADRPVPFPVEKSEGPSREFSLCFWYSVGSQKEETRSSLVLVPAKLTDQNDFYREVEVIADLLVNKLMEKPTLATVYHFHGDSLFAVSY